MNLFQNTANYKCVSIELLITEPSFLECFKCYISLKSVQPNLKCMLNDRKTECMVGDSLIDNMMNTDD